MNHLIPIFLDKIEQRESRLLSWGVTTGGFSQSELEDIISEVLQNNFPDELYSTFEILDKLVADGLLFELPSSNAVNFKIYRSRSAETLRLLNSLKQIMSFNRRAEQPANWRASPNLVADFRYSLRPRLFPKRTIIKEDVYQQLEKSELICPEYMDILDDLLRTKDGYLTLAPFQKEAILQMLSNVKSNNQKGMIITAGTGSGKTYCFYLPALMHIAKEMQKVDKVYALAIYPRNELLKDQLTTAYKLLLKISETVRKKKKRSISIGALLGSTPQNKEKVQNKLTENRQVDWLCPFIKCPNCDGDLFWLKADIEKDAHILNCLNQKCNHRTPHDDMLKLTRERISNSPPHIFFTTTESLNRLMSDSWSYHIIGLGTGLVPDLVLLDEVHTYSGIHGAQVANLLRRWKHGVKKGVHFTGLSATLENAERFMSDMTGIPSKDIVELKPMTGEMEQIGMEYLLALRGDPVSGTALLSTTIQTIMLIRRILEPNGSKKQIYGNKLFAFTDDLDVTNRLYHNLLDAEGYVQTAGQQIRQQNLPLAFYRSSSLEEEALRFEYGQSWRIVEEIGHSLNNRLLIDRTSSQDANVNTKADVVVATASLEVGYDDDKVGAVVQHKTPRDIASFLQRKGRAGRKVNMRPWTIITLSDYGRDRITYQTYEQLFSPVLPEKNLPVHNKYVLRIQASLVLLDWITFELHKKGIKVKLWSALTNLYTKEPSSIHIKILELVEDLLKAPDSNTYKDFTNFLSKSLGLNEDDLYSICWEQPRPLILSVLPTLYRRLKSHWKQFPEGFEVNKHPLPEFMPSSLFADLSLPEVEIILNRNLLRQNQEEENPFMPIEQALKEFSPGRVSRRFGINLMQESHWIPVTAESENQQININDYFIKNEWIGDYEYWDSNGKLTTIPCYRPFAIQVETLPNNGSVKPSSTSFLDWRTYLEFKHSFLTSIHSVPEKIFWSEWIPQIGFFTHNNGNPTTITRFAVGGKAKLNVRRMEESEISKYITFNDGNDASLCALGYTLTVDGLAFHINIPKDLSEQVTLNASLLQGLRCSYFKHLLLTSPDLEGIANDFQREWLYQAFIAAITLESALLNTNIEVAFNNVKKKGIGAEMIRVFNVLFSETGNIEGDEDLQRNHERLVLLCTDNTVITCLEEMAPKLWEQPDAAWNHWLRSCFLSTLGAAIIEAAYQLTPTFDTSELIIDIEEENSRIISNRKKGTHDAIIWLSEKTLGGSGIIEYISNQYEQNPQKFFQLVESALHASDFEIADNQLKSVLYQIKQQNTSIIDSIENVRQADNYTTLEKAHMLLQKTLQKEGLLTVNVFYSALNVRVLRDGSTEQSDQLLISLLETWEHLEKLLGLDIETRLFAYIASQMEQFKLQVQNIVNTENIFGTIYGLLWPRGHMLRSNAMKIYNPFQLFNPADRLLLAPYIHHREVSIDEPDWLAKVHMWLAEKAEVYLVGTKSHISILKDAVLILQGTPIEIGILLLYPQISGILHETNKVKIKITLPENVG